jgi:hypothetical protein
MVTETTLSFVFIWSISVESVEEADERIDLSYIRVGEDKPSTVKSEDYYTLFDLSDKENEIAKYMGDHHNDIFNMISSKHETYKLAAIVVKIDGSIEFMFFKNGILCPDKVSLNRFLYPSFRFLQRLRNYEIAVRKKDEYNSTVVEAKNRYKYTTSYREGKPCVIIEKRLF